MAETLRCAWCHQAMDKMVDDYVYDDGEPWHVLCLVEADTVTPNGDDPDADA